MVHGSLAQDTIVFFLIDYVLSLIFLLIKIFMSSWCYNMNSKSLVVIADQLMDDEALLH